MDPRRNVPGLSRRGFLTASAAAAAGLGAAGLAASSAAAGGISKTSGSLTEAVLAALRTHRLVAISDSHYLQETHDLLMTLISDTRLPGVVDNIVVEFGNAFYQDTIDKFVVDSGPVLDDRVLLTGAFAGLTQELDRLGLDQPDATMPAPTGNRDSDWAAFSAVYQQVISQVPAQDVQEVPAATMTGMVAALHDKRQLAVPAAGAAGVHLR